MVEENYTITDELQVPARTGPLRQERTLGYCLMIFFSVLAAALCWAGFHLLFDHFTLPLSSGWILVLLYLSFNALLAATMLQTVVQRLRQLNQILTQNLPALVVKRDGIVVNTSDIQFGLVRWEQIDKVALSYRPTKSSVNTVARPGIALVLNKHNRPKPAPGMLFFGYNLKLPFYQVYISQDLIAKSAFDVVEQINNFRARMTQ